LYYRLNVISVDLPPLRERLEDLPLLARHFLDRFFARRGRPTPPISEAVIQAFLAYDWPGNVRELENACERIAESASCGRVGIGCVAPSVLFHAPVAATAPDITHEPAARVEETPPSPPPAAPLPDPSPWTSGPFSLDDHLRHEEARLIARALADSRGNKSRAARLLG